MNQRSVRCTFMRGGTSRGPFFEQRDLPAEISVRDRVLLAAMGSPDERQIDGLGGADMLTSKVAIVSPSEQDGIDVDYLFAQVWLDKAIVDTGPSCGNMLAGIGPFAIERGLVKAAAEETRVNVYNVNTQSRIETVIQTPQGILTYEGDQQIDGVPGTAAPILLNFSQVVGSKCGVLFPTGASKEKIQGVSATCIDAAMPMVILRAQDLGLSGYEAHATADDRELMQRIEGIRLEAGERMGLGNVTEMVIPKVSILAQPRYGGTISSCYLTPHHVHAAHAVTGAICVASCVSIQETVAGNLADSIDNPGTIRIEHPSGTIDVELETLGNGAETQIVQAGVVSTARKIMDGQVFVPARLWP